MGSGRVASRSRPGAPEFDAAFAQCESAHAGQVAEVAVMPGRDDDARDMLFDCSRSFQKCPCGPARHASGAFIAQACADILMRATD